MTFSALDILKYFLEPFAYLIYTVIFFRKFRQERSIETKVLFWYYLCATVLFILANLMVVRPLQDINNNGIYNIVYFATICILSWYFYRIFWTKQKRLFVSICFVLNLIPFFVYEILMHHFLNAYNSNIYAFSFICVVVYSFMYFSQLLENVTEKGITSDFNFWLVSGYLLYFLGAFVVIVLYRTVDFDDTGTVWALQNLILLLGAFITFVGYLRTSSKKQYL